MFIEGNYFKMCVRCRKRKQIESFKEDITSEDGRGAICRVCNEELEYKLKDIKQYNGKSLAVRKAYKAEEDFSNELVAMPTLSTNEWLKTCRYFRKCAICGHGEITTQKFFVEFLRGGKYAKNNIIPICDKCSKENKYEVMFLLPEERLNVILKFLTEVNDDAKRRI
jgi:hypothetical protein